MSVGTVSFQSFHFIFLSLITVTPSAKAANYDFSSLIFMTNTQSNYGSLNLCISVLNHGDSQIIPFVSVGQSKTALSGSLWLTRINSRYCITSTPEFENTKLFRYHLEWAAVTLCAVSQQQDTTVSKHNS